MINISNYDYVVFDCDGVILDSNHLKTEAYASTLKREPANSVKQFLEYHTENGGVSRYEKFRFFYEQINPVKDVEAQIALALQRFSEIVREAMIKCDYVPGVLKFIESVHRKGLKLFVASGSDEKELNEVFQERGIDQFFEKIFGSPVGKLEITQKIVEIVGREKKGLFFGDARADTEAAKEAGLDFVFVKGASLWKDGQAELIIQDFRAL